MSVLITRPNADNVIELDEERYNYIVTVDWEYTSARYIMTLDRPDAIKADFTKAIASFPRDEGFVITNVQAI